MFGLLIIIGQDSLFAHSHKTGSLRQPEFHVAVISWIGYPSPLYDCMRPNECVCLHLQMTLTD